VHDTVAVLDPVTLTGLITPQLSPAGTVSESNTVPEKWFSADTVTVDAPDTPTLAVTSEVAAIAKSRNWKSTVAEWTRLLLVPVSVRV